MNDLRSSDGGERSSRSRFPDCSVSGDERESQVPSVDSDREVERSDLTTSNLVSIDVSGSIIERSNENAHDSDDSQRIRNFSDEMLLPLTRINRSSNRSTQSNSEITFVDELLNFSLSFTQYLSHFERNQFSETVKFDFLVSSPPLTCTDQKEENLTRRYCRSKQCESVAIPRLVSEERLLSNSCKPLAMLSKFLPPLPKLTNTISVYHRNVITKCEDTKLTLWGSGFNISKYLSRRYIDRLLNRS